MPNKRIMIHITNFFITSLITTAALALPQSPGIAHPPHIVKPGTPLTAPSGLTPAIIKTAYGIRYVPYQGDGQTIAIIDAYDNPNVESDLAIFNAAFSLPACTTANGCFTKVYAAGSQPTEDPNWDVEISLDVQWAHAIAPNAKILLVEAADASLNALFNAIAVAVGLGARTISLSWGSGEFLSQTTFDSLLRTHVIAGTTFFAASGDSGHAASYPASSTYVIAVGGTTLTVDASGNYVSEAAWSGSGGGLSAIEPETGPQINLPIPNDSIRKRGIPDVAFHANPSNGYSVYDTGSGGWIVVGGTSAASPQWAALLALAKSGTNKRLTAVYSALYAFGKANMRYYFNDITTGTNGGCGYYCAARSGYDYVTGLGSPQAYGVVNNLIYYGYAPQRSVD